MSINTTAIKMEQAERTFGSHVMWINVKVVHIHYVHVFIAGEISFMAVALQST